MRWAAAAGRFGGQRSSLSIMIHEDCGIAALSPPDLDTPRKHNQGLIFPGSRDAYRERSLYGLCASRRSSSLLTWTVYAGYGRSALREKVIDHAARREGKRASNKEFTF